MSTFVNFFCQSCHEPLKLDNSLLDLNLEEFEELSKPIKEITTDFDLKGPLFRPSKTVPPTKKPSELCVIDIRNSNSPEPSERIDIDSERSKGSLAHRLKVASRLFDVASAGQVDHPLCVDCFDKILKHLDDKLEHLTREYDLFANHVPVNYTAVELSEETEARLLEELDELEKKRIQMEKDIELLRIEEEKEVEEEEQRYAERNMQYHERLFAEKQNREHNRARKYYEQEIKRLKKTNVYNETFKIWNEDEFATISGFRMGRLNGQVEWDEVNAAFGQSVLLLYTISRKMDFKFKRFKLLPMGNVSRLISLEENQVLELFRIKGLNDIFKGKKYNQALCAFVDCIAQFEIYCNSLDPKFELPFMIKDNKVKGYSIKYSNNSEKNWTLACKYLLFDLKWILSFFVTHKGQ